MLKVLILSLIIVALGNTIYKFKINAIDGGKIDFSEFRGKKILLVNTASKSRYVNQLYNLEQLRKKYKDSLVVIAVPSNSFGSETSDIASIKELMKDYYGGRFLITEKLEVTSQHQDPLYRWITRRGDNEVMNSEVKGDFQKYLFGTDGHLIGYFVPGVDPMDSLIQKTIENTLVPH
ncbi:MAG: glutathione peroxidase [Segetibacter sp.]|nr:glutathione peroxidase [Segetibacter sp.]